MNKKKIFYYELKRLMCSQEYLISLMILFVYGIILMKTSVMFGTSYTATFSKWTFSDYLSSVTILLLALLMIICARQFSKFEQGSLKIIITTPISLFTLKLIRYGAIACVFTISSVLSMGICFSFYWLFFGYSSFGELSILGIVFILPPALLIFGISMILGNKKVVYIYMMMILLLIVGIFKVSFSPYIDIIGKSVIQTLHNGKYDFTFDASFILGHIIFSLIGIILIIISLKNKSNEILD